MMASDREISTTSTVLVLQDEPILAMVLEDYVEEAGCTPLTVRTAAEALCILEERADIRIVLADLDVRGSVMGMRLAGIIRDRWPPIELVLTGAMTPCEDLPARGEFYRKPFEQERIIAALRRLSVDPGETITPAL